MSLEEIYKLRRLLDESEKRQREEQRRREEAERQLNEERLQTRETTLPEFLDACHVHLFLGLTVQKDKDSSTKGDPANADNKLRPDKILEWREFPQEQMAIWEDLMNADFVTERHFTPLLALRVSGKEVRQRMLSSELDLGYFQRQTVESPVASVIQQLYVNPQLRETFCLNGDIAFENHANTLTDESKIVTEMSSLNLSQEPRRRSERLAARQSASSRGKDRRATQPRSSRPRADQFCVYNKGPEEKVPAFIGEHKAPHKLTEAHIKAGLQDMELDRVVRYQTEEQPEDICRRVVAAVITQTFSYMIQGGLEYGYVCTGEVFIFLRVPGNDPSTVYYYLSIPKEDVGEITGWTGDLNSDNRLHLTSMGQVLAFTLRALRTPLRDTGWRNWAIDRLKTWEMVYDDLLDEIAEQDIPSTDYKPPSRIEFCRVSPVKTRSKSAMTMSCHPLQEQISRDHDDDVGDGFDPNTPSRRPRDSGAPFNSAMPSAVSATSRGSGSKGKFADRQYCTQRCLRGLLMGGKLDPTCPNAWDHGVDRHRLNRTTLISLLDQQLSIDDLGPDSQLGCESLHIHGTRGALFKVTLWSHGYTFIGKGVPVEFMECSKREESVYSRLITIQGVSVPVLVGSLDLRRPFSYDGIAEMVHLMFMSYAGRTLARRHEIDQKQLIQKADKSLQAIHRLGVLHSDPIPGNMTWNEENEQVMFIDFERAIVQEGRMPLGPISPNPKRKREISILDKRRNKRCNNFERETRRMRCELRR